MIPYSELTLNGITHYIHGLAHPVIFCQLKREYVDAVRNYVIESLNNGQIWFAESGLEKAFELPILGIPVSKKRLKIAFLMPIAGFLFSWIPKTERQIFAEQMTSLDDLVQYREMFQPPNNLLFDLSLYLSAKKPRIYKNLIQRCVYEYNFLKSQEQSVHFLCGIAHEFVINYLNSQKNY